MCASCDVLWNASCLFPRSCFFACSVSNDDIPAEPERKAPKNDADADADADTDTDTEATSFCAGIATPLAESPTFYEDNPTLPDGALPEHASSVTMPTATLGSIGLEPARIEDAAAQEQWSRSRLIACNGAAVFQQGFNGTSVEDANAIHSAFKSILGMLAGIAVAEGKLR